MAIAHSQVPEFVLTILSGGEPGQSFVFQQQEITLGRVANNDLVLYDPEVSRRHLVIYHESEQWIVEDLGSSNGTILNGQRLYYPATLQEGDILEVSAVTFRFSSPSSRAVIGENRQGPSVSSPGAPVSPPPPQPAPPARQQEFQQKFQQPEEQRLFQQAAPTGQFPAQLLPVSPPPPPVQGPLEAPPLPPSAGQPLQVQDLLKAPQPFFAPAPVQAPSPQPAPPKPPVAPTPSGIAPPSMPHPGGQPFARREPREPRSYGMLPGAEQHLHLTEGRVRLLAGVCLVFLLLSVALFASPLPGRMSRKTLYTNVIQVSETRPALLEKRVFGYNQYSNDRNMVRKVHFVFRHKGGKVSLRYRLNSPDTLELWLNGSLLLRASPTPSKTWIYKRHLLPRARLRWNKVNRITFQRIYSKASRFWGITQVRLEEQAYPAPSQEKAQRDCQKGHALYKQKERSPDKRFLALVAFEGCRDQLELLPRKPQLYYLSKRMISVVQSELEALYEQYLRQARVAKHGLQSRRIYHKLLRHFPSKSDPRHQRIQQLLRN